METLHSQSTRDPPHTPTRRVKHAGSTPSHFSDDSEIPSEPNPRILITTDYDELLGPLKALICAFSFSPLSRRSFLDHLYCVLMGVHLMGMHLISVHLTGVHLTGINPIGIHLLQACISRRHVSQRPASCRGVCFTGLAS
jgi:hypothetical protein